MPLLRRKAKELGKIIGDDLQAVGHLSAGIESGCVDGTAMDKMPAMAAYAMVHWTFDKSELEGYGFPFDCPHLIKGKLYTVIYEVREDMAGEYYHLVTLWKSTKQEEKLYEQNS